MLVALTERNSACVNTLRIAPENLLATASEPKRVRRTPRTLGRRLLLCQPLNFVHELANVKRLGNSVHVVARHE